MTINSLVIFMEDEAVVEGKIYHLDEKSITVATTIEAGGMVMPIEGRR